MSLSMTQKPDPDKVLNILEDLKKAILNEDSREVMVAVKFFNRFLARPEYWARNWTDGRNSTT